MPKFGYLDVISSGVLRGGAAITLGESRDSHPVEADITHIEVNHSV